MNSLLDPKGLHVGLFSPAVQAPRSGRTDPEGKHKQNLAPTLVRDQVHSIVLSTHLSILLGLEKFLGNLDADLQQSDPEHLNFKNSM